MFSNKLRRVLFGVVVVAVLGVTSGSTDVLATPTYYYPVNSKDFLVTNTFRATVTTSGTVSAIAGSPDGSLFKIKTTENAYGSYAHWQVVLDFGGVLTGNDVHLSVRSTGQRLGGDGRMGTVLNQYIDISRDGVNWQQVEGNWTCEINCASDWFSGISLGARTFRYARLRTTFHHGTHEVGLDAVRVWNATLKPVDVKVLDAHNNTISTVNANGDGWPAPNPLTAVVTLSCPAGRTTCNYPLSFNISGGRFFVLGWDLSSVFGSGIDGCSITTTGTTYSQTGYQAVCQIPVPSGEARTLKWQIWVQPSDVATLSVNAMWQGNGQDTRNVSVGAAQIKPLVFLPGFLGTYPAEHNGKIDPLLHTYDNLLAALQRAGYELGNAGSGATLITFGYDWRNPLGNIGRTTLRNDIDATLNTSTAQRKAYVNYAKVDLMGHSTGGIVARAFIEDSGRNNEQKVNRLITVGTPHRGLPAAYRGWYGGQADALGMNHTQMMSVLTGFAICDDTLDLGGWMDMASGGDFYANALYNYLKLHVPSVQDFLPVADVSYAYLVNNVSPYNQTYPYGRPDNSFLEDLNTAGGDYDVTKITQIPQVVSSYGSSSFDNIRPEARYRVTTPPYGQGAQKQWGYGRVVKKLRDPINVPGDGFVPAYSANLKNVPALNSAGNIVGRNESDISGSSNETLIVNHMSLMSNPVMIRRLVSLLTGQDVTVFENFWNDEYSGTRDLNKMWAIVTCSPVNTLVTDPLGRRAGLDPTTGQIINEIPDAIVSEQGTEPHIILVPEVIGQYQVQGTGTALGAYKIAAMRVVEGNSEPALTAALTGTINTGQTLNFAFDALAFVYLPLILKNTGTNAPAKAPASGTIFSSPVAVPKQQPIFNSPVPLPQKR